VQPDRVWRAVALETESVRSPSAPPPSTQPTVRSSAPPLRIPWFRILIAAGVAVAIAMAVLFGQQRNRHRHDANNEIANKTSLPGELAPDPASLLIEINDGGLQFRNRPVGGDNAVEVFTSVLGHPSRTNQIETLGKSVYVFDDYGLLIYPAREKNPNSIVIDFEGAGGTNGTARPYTGIVRILEDHIGRNTDPSKVAVIRKLGAAATEQGGNSGIYNLKLPNIRIVLASLSRPDRLSLIEIDF
jgi:hypothetical protein